MEEIKTFSKNRNFSFDEYEENYISNEDENEEYEEELLEQQFYEETINIISKEFLNYIDHKSLPICEYLNNKHIDRFIKLLKFE